MSVRQRTCYRAKSFEALTHRSGPFVLALCLAAAATPLGAQEKRRISGCAGREAPGGQELTAMPTLPVMFTVVASGQVVRQIEAPFGSGGNRVCTWLTDLAPGSYDLRAEAAGMRTEVKRGVRLLADQDGSVTFVLNPGSGLRIVEYAQGALAREEVAARLVALESAVAKLQAGAGVAATPVKGGPGTSKP